MYLKNISVCT